MSWTKVKQKMKIWTNRSGKRRRRVKSFQQQLQEATKRLEELQDRFEKTSSELNESKAKNKELNKQMRKKKGKSQSFQHQVQEATRRVEELQDRFEKMSSELNESKAKNEDLGDQNNVLHKSCGDWRWRLLPITNCLEEELSQQRLMEQLQRMELQLKALNQWCSIIVESGWPRFYFSAFPHWVSPPLLSHSYYYSKHLQCHRFSPSINGSQASMTWVTFYLSLSPLSLL